MRLTCSERLGAISAGFLADCHVTCELRVEGTNVILVVMKFLVMDEAVSRVAVTNSLLTRVKVHATIHAHRHLPWAFQVQREFIAAHV